MSDLGFIKEAAVVLILGDSWYSEPLHSVNITSILYKWELGEFQEMFGWIFWKSNRYADSFHINILAGVF